VGAEPIGPACTPKELIPTGFKPICYFDPIDYDMPNSMILLKQDPFGADVVRSADEHVHIHRAYDAVLDHPR